MIQFNIFPGGVKRIVTFSYDDGSKNDARLVELFNKYGVKGTFHLNSLKYKGMTEEELDVYRKLYEGHEISCHTVHHGWLDKMLPSSIVSEVLEDRKTLEHLAGYPVVGMSYPSGTFNDTALEALRSCGIVYSRTTEKPIYPFGLPKEFLTWHPTCHHKHAEEYIDLFMSDLESEWRHPMFYIWGHSHELKTEDDWARMESIVSRLAGSDKIWYATNIEIYNYIKAQRALVVSADETIIYNPSAIPVWVEKDKTEKIMIGAGETVRL